MQKLARIIAAFLDAEALEVEPELMPYAAGYVQAARVVNHTTNTVSRGYYVCDLHCGAKFRDLSTKHDHMRLRHGR